MRLQPTPTQATPAAVAYLPTPAVHDPVPSPAIPVPAPSLPISSLLPVSGRSIPPHPPSSVSASLSPRSHPRIFVPLSWHTSHWCPPPGSLSALSQLSPAIPACPPQLRMLVPLSQPFIQHWGPSAETLAFESEPSPALHYCSAEEKTSLYPEGIVFFPESRCIMNLGSPRVAQPLLPARARTSGKVSSQPDFCISMRNYVFATKRKKNSGCFHTKHCAAVTQNFSCSPALQDKL